MISKNRKQHDLIKEILLSLLKNTNKIKRYSLESNSVTFLMGLNGTLTIGREEVHIKTYSLNHKIRLFKFTKFFDDGDFEYDWNLTTYINETELSEILKIIDEIIIHFNKLDGDNDLSRAEMWLENFSSPIIQNIKDIIE